MVNDFILKADTKGKAAVSKDEYVTGVMKAMVERLMGPSGWDEHDAELKAIRAKNALDAKGPQ